MNYIVSCSGDVTCPPISLQLITLQEVMLYITNLTPMTNYTFSVVATNSIGSGEAGVVMITTPGEITSCKYHIAGIYNSSTVLTSQCFSQPGKNHMESRVGHHLFYG